MIEFFHRLWTEVPLCVFDTETTGISPGRDRAVSFGLARFERGQFVRSVECLVRCDVPIPQEATAIHGITNDMLLGAPPLEESLHEARELYEGAQVAGYNVEFDLQFVPAMRHGNFWPALDILAIVRHLDKYVRGKGRHKLGNTCDRRSIELIKAHSAGADARAAGELLYKIAPSYFPAKYTMGQLLHWCQRAQAKQWFEFQQFKTSLPPEGDPEF